MAKRISEKGKEYRGIERVVLEGAKEYGCPAGDIRLEGLDCPEEIDW